MKTKIPYIEVDYDLNWHASDGNGNVLEKWRELINQPYKDHPCFSNINISAPEELKELHWTINSCHLTRLRLRLYQNGASEFLLPITVRKNVKKSKKSS